MAVDPFFGSMGVTSSRCCARREGSTRESAPSRAESAARKADQSCRPLPRTSWSRSLVTVSANLNLVRSIFADWNVARSALPIGRIRAATAPSRSSFPTRRGRPCPYRSVRSLRCRTARSTSGGRGLSPGVRSKLWGTGSARVNMPRLDGELRVTTVPIAGVLSAHVARAQLAHGSRTARARR